MQEKAQLGVILVAFEKEPVNARIVLKALALAQNRQIAQRATRALLALDLHRPKRLYHPQQAPQLKQGEAESQLLSNKPTANEKANGQRISQRPANKPTASE